MALLSIDLQLSSSKLTALQLCRELRIMSRITEAV